MKNLVLSLLLMMVVGSGWGQLVNSNDASNTEHFEQLTSTSYLTSATLYTGTWTSSATSSFIKNTSNYYAGTISNQVKKSTSITSPTLTSCGTVTFYTTWNTGSAAAWTATYNGSSITLASSSVTGADGTTWTKWTGTAGSSTSSTLTISVNGNASFNYIDEITVTNNATNYYWGGATNNTTGNWDNSATKWNSTASGSGTLAWPSSGSYNANINTTGGNLTLNQSTIAVAPANTLLGASTTFSTAGSQSAILSSPVSLAANTLTLSPATATNLTLSGNITSSGSPTTSLSVNTGSGSGNVILSGTNSYTGATTVDGTGTGQLQIATVGALATGSAVTVTNGGGLRLNVTGTHGGTSQSFSFTPNQSTNPTLDCGNFAATLQGNISLSPTSGGVVRIEANGASSALTLSGNITGTGLLQKQATGTLILSGTGNNYSGGTRVGNGTLTVNSGSSISTGLLDMYNFNSGTVTLNLNNTAQTVSSLTSNFSVTTGTNANIINLGSGHTLTVNQSTNTTYGTGAVGTLTSILAGSGGLTKTGTGTLTLSGANTYTGNTAVNGGTLSVTGSLASGSAVSVGASGTLAGTGTVSGTVSVTGTISPAGSGVSGTLTTGANTWNNTGTYTCDITDLSSTNCDLISSTGTLTSSATFTVNATLSGNAVTNFNSNTAYSWTIATFSAAPSVANLALNVSGVSGYTGIFTLAVSGNSIIVKYTPSYYWPGNDGTWGTANAWRLGSIGGTSATWANNNAAVLSGTAGTITVDASYTPSSIAVNTTGYTLASSTATNYNLTAPITLANSVNLNLNSGTNGGGTLGIGSVTGGTSSGLTITGNNTSSTFATRIDLQGGATIATTAPIIISTTGSQGLSGFVANGSSATSTINATIANSTSTPTMLGATSGNTLTLGGVISGSAPVQFSAGTSGGAGITNVNAAGTWTGATRFNGATSGTIKLGIANGISTTSDVTMGYSSGQGQTLDLNGYSQQLQSLSSGSGTGGITNNGASNATLTINQSSNTSFGLNITDGSKTIALTKSGTGTLTLTGTNTFSGGVTINSGYLSGSSETALFGNTTTNGITLNGGGIQSTGNINFNTASRVITLGASGGYFDATNGTMTHSKVMSGTGTFYAIGGTNKIGIANAIPSGSTLNMANTSGCIVDLNTFNQTIAALTGGGTTGGNITNNGGSNATLTVSNTSGSSTYAGVISDGSTNKVALTKSGVSTLILSGTNTYTGATTVSTNGGTLAVTGSLASGSAVTVNSGGTLAGTGTVNGTVSVAGTISPNTTGSIGTLTTGALTLTGTYNFDISKLPSAGTAGTDWDKIVCTNLTNSSSFTVAMSGTIPSFNNATSYTWLIGTYSGSLTGTGTVTVTTTGLSGVTINGSFSVSISGGNINLVYTPAPVNDLCSNATTLAQDGTTASGTLVNSLYSSLSNDTYSNGDVWYKFTATSTGTVSVSTANTGMDIDIFAFSSSCPSDASVYTSYGGQSSSTSSESMYFAVTSGTTYYIRVALYSGTASTFTINASYTPSLSNWVITSSYTPSVSTNITATTLTNGSPTVGSGVSGVSATPNATYGFGGNNFSSSTSLSATKYYQFSMAPTTGNGFNVSQVSITCNASAGSTAKIDVYWSIDGFTSSTFLATTTSIGTTAYVYTYNLANGGTLPTQISAGKTLSFRVYPYSISSTSTYFDIAQFTVYGNVGALSSISSASSSSSTYGGANTFQLSASNSPTSYGIRGSLPTGFSFNSSTGLLSVAATAAAGTYTIYDSAINVYGISSTQTLAYTVNKAALSITAKDTTRPYGTILTGGAGSTLFTSSGLVNGETIGSVTISYLTPGNNATDAVGTYTGKDSASAATGGTFNTSNYNITYNKGSITVTPATLTYIANSASKIYGAANPSFSGTVTGFVNGETQSSATTGTLSFTTTATAASTPGSYAITGIGLTANNGNYTFAQASGNSTAFTINAGSAGSWVGVTSTDFNTASNWQNNAVPSSSDAIVVSSGATYYPVLAGNTTVASLSLASGTKLSIGAGNTLTLNGTVSGTGNIVGSNTSKLTLTNSGSIGTLYFDQTTSADVSVTDGSNALQNLVLNGGGSVTLGNKLNLFNRLSVSGSSTLNTGDYLVLRSTSSNTAYVDQVAGTINGQTTVERYIHKQGRGWRALTAPITYNNISQGYISGNWQSDWGYTNNYGTRITGPTVSNGIDEYTSGNSLQTYNSTTGAWNKVNNTNTETQSGNSASAANKGFYIFVRGDRTVTAIPGSGTTPNSFVSTTLAAKGKLQTGNQTFNYTGTSGKSWLIGNPYACPVDMSAVSMTGVTGYVYIWDPNLTGAAANTNGNFTTFDPGDWNQPPVAGSSTKHFQSGQAFFVITNSASAHIDFTEASKTTSSNNNTQTTGSVNGSMDLFNVKLYNVQSNGTTTEVDGARAKFGANYSASVDADDAIKWSTAGIENLSLSRDNKSLSIEARPYITSTDSLFLSTTSLSVANYQFKVNPINFDASVSSCKLVDRFLNTETPISLTNTTVVDFSVTSVAGSNAANRFYFVFNAAGSLPTNNNLTVKAYKKDKSSVAVEWTATAENNVKTYSVEHATDGVHFTKLSESAAKNGNTTNDYSYTDNHAVAGMNYYRIQSTQNNSNIVYSTIVRVEMNDKGGVVGITVYPNPVRGNTVGLQLNNMAAGKYTAKLYNNLGQEVFTSTINHNGNNGAMSMQLSNSKTLASGNYELQLTDANGNHYNQTVIVVNN